VQAWIVNGQVTVNGRLVSRVSTRAAQGDVVTVLLPDDHADRLAADRHQDVGGERAGLDILYEDDHLLVIDKPAGVVVHPTYKHVTGTLMNALRCHARAWPVGSRPSLVGRLDRLTSGILVVAKTATVHAALQREMASSCSEKDYLAIVYGKVTSRGTIDLRLRVDSHDRRRIVPSTDTGAQSVTRFVRIARGAGVSLVHCRLITGRRHQIRVHLAARGWPIVGDPAYLTAGANGKPRWSSVRDPTLAEMLRTFPRQALHARRVAFTHPGTGQRIALEAPLPEDIRALLAAAGLGQPLIVNPFF
jgi:23S rRNA pseudouridine1911/1915/1917 synthase